MKRITTGLALAGLSLGLAHAAPAPQSVEESVSIAAPPARVWAIVQNFNDMSWVPPIKATTATRGNEPGSTRTLDLGGPQLVEELASYDAAGRSYSYRITDLPANKKVLPVSDYRSTIRVAEAPGGGSTVTWRGDFLRADTADQPAAGMGDQDAVTAVRGVYRAGLENVAKRAAAQ